MAVIDVTTFNGEYDLFGLRYQILKDYVDEFIVVEAKTTFSGQPKPLYSLSEDVFCDPIPRWPKVRVWEVDESWSRSELQEAIDSPNTQGADHWKLEFLQKESIKKALKHLKDDDTVFIGDVDEIWNPNALDLEADDQLPLKLKLKVYTYWLNNRSSEDFWGTLVSSYGYIKRQCLNHLRTNSPKTSKDMGWHFTSMGGTENVKKKLTDSYTHESYASPSILDSLEYNIAENKDFLGRDFSYKLDESEWPEFLKETRENYKHLIKNYA